MTTDPPELHKIAAYTVRYLLTAAGKDLYQDVDHPRDIYVCHQQDTRRPGGTGEWVLGLPSEDPIGAVVARLGSRTARFTPVEMCDLCAALAAPLPSRDP